MHPLEAPFASPRRLSQSVILAGELLGLVRAEVARVLGFRCENITALYEGRLVLEPGSAAYTNGVLLVRLYQALYARMGGDGPRMIHWLRADHRNLGKAPFYLLVDEGQVGRLVAHLEGMRVPPAAR